METSHMAKEIIAYVGGSENILKCTHCSIRLRLVLKDETLTDELKIKSIEGVKGLIKREEEYHIIIGIEVDEVYDEVIKIIT